MVKAIIKRTNNKGSNFQEAFAAWKNKRNVSGFSSNQLFFLRNIRDPKQPALIKVQITEGMVKARVGQRAERMQWEVGPQA